MSIRSMKYAILLSLLLLLSVPAQAQQLLTYGTGATGTLSAATPVVLYTFQGDANDAITLQVLALSGDLQPVISLNSGTGAQVAASSSDASNPLANSARLNTTLPDTGTYTVIVTSASGSSGDYAIRLDGAAIAQQPDVIPGTPGQLEIVPGRSAVRYMVPADPENLLLAALSVTGTNTIFSVAVTAPDGQAQTTLSGNQAAPVVIALAPAEGAYTLDVQVNAASLSVLSLNVTQSGAAPAPAPTAVPLPTDVSDPDPVDPTPDPTEEASSPEATFTPVSQATAIPATATATTAVQQATPTFTPSYTPTTVQQATATFTPSYTPTTVQQATAIPATATATTAVQQATPTFTPSYTPTTPPAAQVAPEDARFNNALQIPLDNTVSVLDFVSYPDGDREDRVRYEVTGMNNNSSASGGRARLVISASCFGENTDQIQFFTGGQTYTCGQTLIDREVTADSDTGSIVITAVGGQGTYVQWVLTGTATRVN